MARIQLASATYTQSSDCSLPLQYPSRRGQYRDDDQPLLQNEAPGSGGYSQKPELSDKQTYITPPPSAHREFDHETVGSPGTSKGQIEKESVRSRPFPRISRPVELLRNSYDCVVIGSGYGGAIAASRMARAGESICVLERGEEKWPGEYPATFAEAAEQFHFSGDFAPNYVNGRYSPNGRYSDVGSPTGMYHLIFGRDQSAVVANGLGGTSLINANVFLEADKSVLEMGCWPPEIKEEPGCLEEYYQKVKDVLEPEPYPSHWPKLKKVEVFERQARDLGLGDKFYNVPQTTRFRSGPNSCGVNMSQSTLTGQDAMGINDGSKTTTLVTYLADAWNWGAEMFCRCEVRYIEKVQDERGGYIIYFVWHGPNRGRFQDTEQGDFMWVHAKNAVFLGAGAIGTTEILLRSKEMGLSMSDWVGRGMSGNGDMLAFGYDSNCEVNAIGRPFPCSTDPVGPTINSIIDNRAGLDNPLNGFVIEEGAIPQALSDFLQNMLDLMPGSRSSNKSLLGRAQEAMDKWKSRLLGPYNKSGAVEKTQVFLIMSHDGSQATLSLKDDKPILEFLGVGKSERVKKLNDLLAKATSAVGGTLVQSPFYAVMGDQEITVHPLGGAQMSRDNTGVNGVTNHVGEVFTGSYTSETHNGLIVTDGSLIPTALGVNPFATIAALAERAVAEYAKSRHLVINDEKNGVLDLFGEPAHQPKSLQGDPYQYDDVSSAAETLSNTQLMKAGRLEFTELMTGFVHKSASAPGDDKAMYESAFRAGKGRGEVARLLVSATVLDANMLLDRSGSSGLLTGTFVCPALKGSPFMVLRGKFGLFKLDEAATGTSQLTYDFDMTGTDGKCFHFHGYKVIDSSVALDPRQLWHSTTTLYVKITEQQRVIEKVNKKAHEENSWSNIIHRKSSQEYVLESAENAGVSYYNKTIAMGILHLRPRDFLSEVLTLTPTGNHLFEKATNVASFVSFFTLKSLSFFLAPLAPLQYPVQAYQTYSNYTPPTQSYIIVADDGVRTEMHMWEPSPRLVATDASGAPVQLENLFMIPGASVDHQIFALPTIPFNAVNYFTRAGYRVFVTVHRICSLRSTRGQSWTTYDSRLDIKACLERIRRIYGNGKVYTIAHCMGSVAFSCGLLDGTIPADWILGVSCSQVFMNPIWNTLNMIKATSPVALDKMYGSLLGEWFDCTTSRQDTVAQQAVNQMLRFYPEERQEMCNNAACHRTTLLFGRCWSHHNLNEATHRNIDRFFGGASMTLISLLKRMGTRGEVSTNAPAYQELTTPENVKRLRGIPFLFFVGMDSAVLSPTATEKTYERLVDTFGISAGIPGGGIQYRRRVVPGYGHLDCWMGRNAWRDVFPFVREEVDRVVRGELYHYRQPDDRFRRYVEAGEI